MVDINEYMEEKSCVYRGEEYIVRDNGAILRKSIPNKRKRYYDNEWTFGRPSTNGYLAIASVPIHRIVATAFHGEPPTKEHVVDHIDTNKRNNRPNNLRWITRLENVVLNEITRKKIEYIIGASIYEFLDNPAQYRDCFDEQSYSWMRTVSAEEAKACLKTLTLLCKKEDKPRKSNSSKMGEWVYRTRDDIIDTSYIFDSLTPTAKQINWRTPCEFICCPLTIADKPLEEYYNNLSNGKVFNKNQYGESTVEKFVLADEKTILIMTNISEQSKVKNYALAKITYEDGYYMHESLTFFFEDGAEKAFMLAQEVEWTYGDTFDDFC